MELRSFSNFSSKEAQAELPREAKPQAAGRAFSQRSSVLRLSVCSWQLRSHEWSTDQVSDFQLAHKLQASHVHPRLGNSPASLWTSPDGPSHGGAAAPETPTLVSRGPLGRRQRPGLLCVRGGVHRGFLPSTRPLPLLAPEPPAGVRNKKRKVGTRREGDEPEACVRPLSPFRSMKNKFYATLVTNKISTSTLRAQLSLSYDKACLNLFNETFYHELSLSCEFR